MKKGYLLLVIFILLSITGYSQKIALKNNLIYDATLTPNLSLEIGLGKKTTLDIGGGYNPFTFSDHKKFKHWLVQPEFRWWLCERFNGTFFGVHAHGAEFSFACLKLPFGLFKDLKDHRYEGYLYGGGVSIGHQWMLGKRWNLEASIGAGYARIHYDKYECKECAPLMESKKYNYWGITRANISFVYFIR